MSDYRFYKENDLRKNRIRVRNYKSLNSSKRDIIFRPLEKSFFRQKIEIENKKKKKIMKKKNLKIYYFIKKEKVVILKEIQNLIIY